MFFKDDYIPKHWHNFIPLGLLIIGLYVGQNNPATYDVVGFCIASYLFAIIVAWQVNIGMTIYRKYLYPVPDDGKRVVVDQPKLEQKEKKYLNMSPVYENSLQIVSVNKIRQFGRMLITMREQGMFVDLREIKWRNHFGSDKQYRIVRDVKMAGAFVKEYPRDNSPFIVRDWNIVQDAADNKIK